MDYIKDLRKYIGNKKIILNCAGAVIVKDDKILLQHRSDNDKWGLIGGLLELNETYEEAVYREVKEESNLDIKLEYFLGIFHNHDMIWSNGDRAHTIGAYYVASITGGEIQTDEESYELKFFAKDELPELFAKDHREALNAYFNGIKMPLLNENKYEDK